MSHRVHNFGAGPATLPLSVLEQVQRDLLDFGGTGMSILEMSHRSSVYDRIHGQTIDDLRSLLGADDDFAIAFMGGGARTQFSLVPMNLLPPEGRADYVVTGRWSEMALEEARKVGQAEEVWSSAGTGHDRVPARGSFEVRPGGAYLHYTSNNTIAGTQYPEPPESGEAPLVCDMSSDILSRPLDIHRFGMIYAGAQKNLGPAGVTVVILRRELLERSSARLGDMLSYARVVEKNSLLNTPPVFAIYVVGLVARWLLDNGGVEAAAARNLEKGNWLYRAIDESGGFYRGHAQKDSRSLMNVTFRLPNAELEARFVAKAAEAGLVGLKGHRSLGGIRASLYNATSLQAVKDLVAFMQQFQQESPHEVQ